MPVQEYRFPFKTSIVFFPAGQLRLINQKLNSLKQPAGEKEKR